MGARPVSYTHLDVYKRQPLDTTTQREFLRKIHELAPARETYLFVDDYHLVEGEMRCV